MDRREQIKKLERENDQLRNLIHSLVEQFGSVIEQGRDDLSAVRRGSRSLSARTFAERRLDLLAGQESAGEEGDVVKRIVTARHRQTCDHNETSAKIGCQIHGRMPPGIDRDNAAVHQRAYVKYEPLLQSREPFRDRRALVARIAKAVDGCRSDGVTASTRPSI